MRLIAELQGAPENDNGIVGPASRMAPGDARAEMLQTSASNDGRATPPAAAHTLMVFLPDDGDDDSECASDETTPPAGVALLPILHPANDDEPPADADAILAADPTFAEVLDEARERWIEAMDLAAATEPNDFGAEAKAPRAEGADDDECA